MTAFDKAWSIVKINEERWTPDNLWVVAENQMGGWEACDSINGGLLTYANQADAQKEADDVIADLTDNGLEGYGPDSWAGVLLRDAKIGDNQEHIVFPDGSSMSIDEWEGQQDPLTEMYRQRMMDGNEE